jgi:carbonic anhydrase
MKCWRQTPNTIRNAGGRASDDAIRSLVISYKLLGTREWFVIHHTDCGMMLFTNEDMSRLFASSLRSATVDHSGWHDTGQGPGSTEGNYMNWRPGGCRAYPESPPGSQ